MACLHKPNSSQAFSSLSTPFMESLHIYIIDNPQVFATMRGSNHTFSAVLRNTNSLHSFDHRALLSCQTSVWHVWYSFGMHILCGRVGARSDIWCMHGFQVAMGDDLGLGQGSDPRNVEHAGLHGSLGSTRVSAGRRTHWQQEDYVELNGGGDNSAC